MSLSASGLPFTCQIAPVIDTLAFTVFNRFHRASPPWASTASRSRSFISLTANLGETPTEFTTKSPRPRSLQLRGTRSLPRLYSCSRIANCRFPRFFYTKPDLHARSALMREHISFRAFSAEPEMLYPRWFCGRLWISRRDSNQSAFAVVKRQAAVGIQASLEHTFRLNFVRVDVCRGRQAFPQPRWLPCANQ